MMKHPNTHKTKSALMAASTCFFLIATGSTALAQVATRDSVTNSNTGSTANAMANVNAQTTLTRQSTQEIQAAIGPAGNSPAVGAGALGDAIGTGSSFYQNMQRFSYDMCAVTLCENSDPSGSTDIDEVREWAMENFYADEVLDEPTRRDLLEIRRRGVAYSTTSALALAVTVHNDLAGADGTANALQDKVDQSPHLRGDVQANSAILLAQYKVALQQLAVMNASMEVIAARGITETDIYHEEGGASFADALNDDDFSDAGFSVRTRVTVPDKGAAGALGLLTP